MWLASGCCMHVRMGPDRRLRALQMDWNSLFCGRCGDGGELLECDGTCLRSFHQHCLTPSERPSPDDPPDAKW